MAYKAQNKNLPPLDDQVVLPAAIRAQALRAETLHNQQYETPAAEQKQNGEERQQTTPEPKQEVKAPEAGAEKVPVSTPSEGENFEHKYNSLKGRYDKQEDMLRQLNNELGSMRSEITRLSSAPAPKQTNENSFKKITDEERAAYGEDFIDVSARAARETLDPEIQELKRTVAELSGQLGSVAKVTHDTQTLSMNQTLDSKVPDWRKINRDPKFIAWLNLRDPFSGAIRMNMLKDAHDSGDALRVLNFFQGFLRDEAVVDPAAVKADIVTPKGNDKVSLESLAAPGRAKASAAAETIPDEQETITRAQVSNFYKLVNAGHYKGNEDTKNALEARIFRAQAEGRII